MSTIKNILPHHGEALHYEQFFSGAQSDVYFKQLLHTLPWKQEPIKLFGKEIMQPRLTAFYSDEGINYRYSGIQMEGNAWTKELQQIKQAVEEVAGLSFNSALLNLYRNGNDSMGWHRDNEKELGLNPAIASVSFGHTRKFQLRTYKNKDELITLNLAHGSFLLMRGETQPYWEHRLPKSKSVNGERINITFRQVLGKSV